MNKNDFLEELIESVYDEEAYINVLAEYSINCREINDGYVFRLLTKLSSINAEILKKIDDELYLTKN